MGALGNEHENQRTQEAQESHPGPGPGGPLQSGSWAMAQTAVHCDQGG